MLKFFSQSEYIFDLVSKKVLHSFSQIVFDWHFPHFHIFLFGHGSVLYMSYKSYITYCFPVIVQDPWNNQQRL